ncbi:MAG TPA: 16S rRNA (uracil(1498)-N(3))-methyltransferase [Gammaproteobacteria bacterium]|nr:16S rRNA (uracil(1498)-N(3))-methyltransferase [Gammaproteobacteria bacterium]
MRVPRLYVDKPFTTGTSVTLDDVASHHLSRVLRARVGQEVCLFNGMGLECRGRLLDLGARRATVAVETCAEVTRESALPITLVQGISRGERMDFTLQKAVELGVGTIVPVIMERTVVRLDAAQAEKRRAHWRKIVIHACEQCGRNHLPELRPVRHMNEWLALPVAGAGIVLRPEAAQSLAQMDIPAHGGLTVMIGPEGGMSETEVALAGARGYRPVRLGPRILRTETASLAALAAIQALWGDYR